MRNLICSRARVNRPSVSLWGNVTSAVVRRDEREAFELEFLPLFYQLDLILDQKPSLSASHRQDSGKREWLQEAQRALLTLWEGYWECPVPLLLVAFPVVCVWMCSSLRAVIRALDLCTCTLAYKCKPAWLIMNAICILQQHRLIQYSGRQMRHSLSGGYLKIWIKALRGI